jgi:flagellar operon protein
MAIDRVGLQAAAAYPLRTQPRSAGPAGTSFADALGRASEQVQLSRHAQKRIERRELNLDPQRLARLDSAITRAAEKGGRNSVVMLDDLAVVVNVRERTVVTAMPKEGSHQRVFTNVDSVVIA